MTKKTKTTRLSEERQKRRELAESDLEEFIALVHPRRTLGSIHKRVIAWWTRQNAMTHQMLLLPRDHMKSALIAYRVAWELTRDPTLRILFISSTSNLAIKQLKFIKDILTCDNYRIHWPEMIEQEEAKREKWTEREISVDHPRRKEESIRDPSIFTAGLTSNIVGMHCDIAVLDDVVVAGNAYTETGREKVKDQYSLLSSIETVNAKEWVVGTRYHPNDLYADLIAMEIHSYDERGNVNKATPLFELIEEQVESVGDGTGEFLWPRSINAYGRWYGFDEQVLSVKRGQYINQTHFRAQYYNDPHDYSSSAFQKSYFQYYEPSFLMQQNGRWYYKKERLNIFASVDFAYTTGKKSDFTSIVVVGVDGNSNYFVLEIDRFKTSEISEYYRHIFELYSRWGFHKLRAEVSAAQVVIVKDLKENYIRKHGLSLAIDEFRPSRWQGSKEERIEAVLQPRYANMQIWHCPSGNTQLLEAELLSRNPPHDDIKDALASAIDFAIPPLDIFRMKKDNSHTFNFHSRWGGVA